MISGLRLALAVALAIPLGAPGQDDPRLVALMQDLAQVKNARGKFVERKYLAMLESPARGPEGEPATPQALDQRPGGVAW